VLRFFSHAMHQCNVQHATLGGKVATITSSK